VLQKKFAALPAGNKNLLDSAKQPLTTEKTLLTSPAEKDCKTVFDEHRFEICLLKTVC